MCVCQISVFSGHVGRISDRRQPFPNHPWEPFPRPVEHLPFVGFFSVLPDRPKYGKPPPSCVVQFPCPPMDRGARSPQTFPASDYQPRRTAPPQRRTLDGARAHPHSAHGNPQKIREQPEPTRSPAVPNIRSDPSRFGAEAQLYTHTLAPFDELADDGADGKRHKEELSGC